MLDLRSDGAAVARRVMRVVVPLLCAIHDARAQAMEIRVDPRVELLAVVFRLAGRSEYNLTRVPPWATAVDSSFGPYRNHPAVEMTRRLGFGFFIPMNLAIHVSPPPSLAERSPFSTSKSLHRRWTTFPDSTQRYLNLLRSFASDTRFMDFLSAHQALVDSASVRLRRAAGSIDRAWIDQFWGGSPGTQFVLAAGITNGGVSYGQEFRSASGESEAYAIIGVRHADAGGFPLYDAEDVSTILHEMNHPYVTPLIRANADAFRPFADSLYAPVAAKMREQAYGTWDAMLNESLVRAAVIRYQLAHGDTTRASQTIDEETALGFVWTRRLVELLGEYERDRKTYATMATFMPRVVELFRSWQ
jgi:hypothetical protein